MLLKKSVLLKKSSMGEPLEMQKTAFLHFLALRVVEMTWLR